MDQKRILWIVAAAGIFLLVVFGAAAILYSPAAEPARAIVSNTPPSSQTKGGWATPPATTQPLAQQTPPADAPASKESAAANGLPVENASQQNTHQLPSDQYIAQVGDMTVISQNTTVYGLQQQYPPAEQSATTIDLNTTQKHAPQVSANVTATNQAGAAAIAKTNAPTASSANVASANNKNTATPPPAKQAPAPSAQTKTTSTQYWVQAASFTSKKSADNAVGILDDNKIPANIFTYQDTKGTLYYRIRVGPYVTKSEAEYWQTRIAKIDTFAKTNSYVTSTTNVQ